MPVIWPLNLWGFARLIEPRKCCAYLAWFDIRPLILVSPAAEQRIRLETLWTNPNATEWTWPLYAHAAYDRRAQRLRSNARHLIQTVLPHRVRNALRGGSFLVTGVRADGHRVEISEDDLAGLSVDLANDCLTGATVVFERISIRPRNMIGVKAEVADSSTRPLLIVPEGMIGLRDAVEEAVRALFGPSFVAEFAGHELKRAGATSSSRTQPWEKAIEQIRAALKAGGLIGYAVQAAQSHRVPLPQRYWDEWIAEWRPFQTGRVDVPPGPRQSLPTELRDIAGWPIAIEATAFRTWLHTVRRERGDVAAGPLSRRRTSELVPVEQGEARTNPLPTDSHWMPLHEAVEKIVETTGQSIEMCRRKIWQAVEAGQLSCRGRGASAASVFSPIPASLLSERPARARKSGSIDWHDAGSAPTLTVGDDSETVTYSDLQIERDGFDAWLFLTKPEKAGGKLGVRYVGIQEALRRLRQHVKATEHRVALHGELARIMAEDVRSGRLKIWWLYEGGHAISIDTNSWEPDRLPQNAPAEKLILNGAVKGKRLVFIRAEFARWLGDRPDEANPPPQKLEQRDAAPIPLIAREWSREPGAEPEEKIAGRLWRAYFDGEFALQTVEGAAADFDRESFATMIEVNKEADHAVLGPAPRDDPEFGYRALGKWAAEGFSGMSPWFRLASVESYLLPRSSLARWCQRAGQPMPRFWQSRIGGEPGASRSGMPSRRPPSRKAMREWYTARVAACGEAGTQPSREEDYRDAVQKFGTGVTHEVIRSLRNELASHWTKPGRRPGVAKGK